MTYVDPSNVNRAPICLDFFSTSATVATKVRAFTSESTTDGGKTWTAPATTATPQIPGGWNQSTAAGPGNVPPAVIMGPTTAAKAYATTPGGDQFAFSYGSATTYAAKVMDITNGSATSYNANWERDGYDFIYSAQNPSTMGTTVSSYYTGNTTQASSTTTALTGTSGVVGAPTTRPTRRTTPPSPASLPPPQPTAIPRPTPRHIRISRAIPRDPPSGARPSPFGRPTRAFRCRTTTRIRARFK